VYSEQLAPEVWLKSVKLSPDLSSKGLNLKKYTKIFIRTPKPPIPIEEFHPKSIIAYAAFATASLHFSGK